MYGLTTIHKLNREAAEASYICAKHRYLATLTEDQRLGFKHLAPDMQKLLVRQHLENRKEINLEHR